MFRASPTYPAGTGANDRVRPPHRYVAGTSSGYPYRLAAMRWAVGRVVLALRDAPALARVEMLQLGGPVAVRRGVVLGPEVDENGRASAAGPQGLRTEIGRESRPPVQGFRWVTVLSPPVRLPVALPPLLFQRLSQFLAVPAGALGAAVRLHAVAPVGEPTDARVQAAEIAV